MDLREPIRQTTGLQKRLEIFAPIRTTADAVAKRLGLSEVIAGVLPEQKAQVVKDFQKQGRIVAMAGDGINDAPGLSQAFQLSRTRSDFGGLTCEPIVDHGQAQALAPARIKSSVATASVPPVRPQATC